MRTDFKILSTFFISVMLIFAGSSAFARGDGSQSNPYSCAEVIALNNPGTKVWIKGYIIGTMNTNYSPYVFERNPPFTFYANIFLADSPDETDSKKCVPVQLASGSTARAELNLVDNPEHLGTLYALEGELLAYFGQPGFKNIVSYTELDPSAQGPGEDPEPDPYGGIDPNLIFDITVPTPGALQGALAALDADEIQGLAIKGKLNSDDIIYINTGAGRISSVKYLDLSEVTIDYDGKVYASNVNAPEAGMGTAHTYNYILSEENYDEEQPFDFIAGYTTNCYRNNLSNAFCRNNRIEVFVMPKWLTSIGAAILYYCENLRLVTLPEGVVEIGDRAFGGCSSLAFLEIPSTVERIGVYAFNQTTIRQDKLTFDRMDIGHHAFSYCKGFRALEITNPTDTLQDYAFNHCYDLKEIKLGEGLKYIGNSTFKSCNIVTVDLPASLAEIGDDTFLNCPFINSLPVEGNIKYLEKIAYDLTDRSQSEYTVREGTKMLVHKLFLGFGSSIRVNLPSSIEILGKQSLSQINFTTLPELPNLRKIYDRAFENCPLSTVVIPEKVELIHYNAFAGCDKIWKVTYNAINATVVNDMNLFDHVIEQVMLGDKVERIPAGLFTENSFITEITLPACVKTFAPRAFAGCAKLERINLNDNIIEIPQDAFYGCQSLKKIHWPANLKRVGREAFRNCSSLEIISLPEGLTTFEPYAFYGCASVHTLYIPSTLEEIEYAYDFGIHNPSVEHFMVTCTAETPYNMGWSFSNMAKTTFKVPAASLDKYKSDRWWNGSSSDTNAPEIIAIETISASENASQTTFANDITSGTDLSDAVVGSVYVTLGQNDGYDAADGSIYISDAMDDEYVDALGGMAPGISDLANRFNGLVIQVPAGAGTVTVNCKTLGNKLVSVKIGSEEPQTYSKDERGDITIQYDVTEDTYIYIYSAENDDFSANRAPSQSNNCVKIYSIGINPEYTGIETVSDEATNNPIIDYWRLDGTKVNKPQSHGIYIGRRADGSAVKIQIK